MVGRALDRAGLLGGSLGELGGEFVPARRELELDAVPVRVLVVVVDELRPNPSVLTESALDEAGEVPSELVSVGGGCA